MPHVSLESLNFPGHFIRHAHFLGELNKVSSDLDEHDATFLVPDGAFTDQRPFVLRSVNFPFHVLRHQDFRLKLHEFNPPLMPPGGQETAEQRLLREDSHYIAVRGNADPNGVSFRSLNFDRRFIRHRDFHLFVEDVTDDLSRKDSTFFVREPFVPTGSPPPLH